MSESFGSRSSTRRSARIWPVLATLFAASWVAACSVEGSAGPEGPAGQTGQDGSRGEDGEDGEDGDGIDGIDGIDGKDGEDAIVDPSLSPLEKAYVGVGGKEALAALSSITLAGGGANWIIGEGFEPEDVGKFSSYTTAVKHDLGTGNLRVDYQREVTFFGFPIPLDYKEIIQGNLGVTTGTVSILGGQPGPMPSDRWASSWKTHRLLHPQLILKDVADGALAATDGGPAVLDGALHHLVVVEDNVYPITLWVSAQTGNVTKLHTVESDPVLRDVSLEAFYEGWSPSAQGVRYPAEVYIARDEVILRQEVRTAFATNEAIAATEFDFPAGSTPTFDDVAAEHGATSSQVNQMFAAVGIPLDGIQTFVAPVEVKPGVWEILGGSHNTMVVEQATGLVVADAPLYNQRTDAILAWAKTQFPSKPVKWVTMTHFHDDHMGGLRAFAAEGVTIVVGAASEEYVERSLTAKSTVVPDKLSMAGGNYTVITVDKGGSFTIPDAVRPVTAYSFDSAHAADMLMIHAPSAKIVWVSDIYSAVVPPPAPAANFLAQQLHTAIVQKALDVDTLITGHGNGANTFAQFQTTIGL